MDRGSRSGGGGRGGAGKRLQFLQSQLYCKMRNIRDAVASKASVIDTRIAFFEIKTCDKANGADGW